LISKVNKSHSLFPVAVKKDDKLEYTKKIKTEDLNNENTEEEKIISGNDKKSSNKMDKNKLIEMIKLAKLEQQKQTDGLLSEKEVLERYKKNFYEKKNG
jgi:hypothetical protein